MYKGLTGGFNPGLIWNWLQNSNNCHLQTALGRTMVWPEACRLQLLPSGSSGSDGRAETPWFIQRWSAPLLWLSCCSVYWLSRVPTCSWSLNGLGRKLDLNQARYWGKEIKNMAYRMSLSLVQITLHSTEWCWSVFFAAACLLLVFKWFNRPWSHICWPLQALN